jgi:hypothetical protein
MRTGEEAVPLSEHEQRLLEQIERALVAEDPKFASTVRATDPRSRVRRRIILSGILLVAGAGLMIAGVLGVTRLNVFGVPVLGVIGFLVMFAAVLRGVTIYRRGTAPEPLRVVGGRSSRTPAGRQGFVDRLENRWRRRADDGR